MATSMPELASILSRIDHLEKPVSGLMTTMSQLYDKFYLDKFDIPKPDAHVALTDLDQKANEKSVLSQTISKATSHTLINTSKVEPIVIPSRDLEKLEPYEYSPLNTGASEIRIFSMSRSKTANEPVECQISTVNLPDSLSQPDPPRFMPLSYTWGRLEKTETILLNGQSFSVTKNLHTALKHFRNADSNSLESQSFPHFRSSKPNWWVDAICINQEDLDERKSQVALMTRIYRMADIAHVWLGEEAEDSSLAMKLIKELSHKASDSEQEKMNERKDGQTHRFRGPGTIPEKIPEAPTPITEDEKNRNYQAIVKLFKREWFSRVWILQEMALPQDVVIHCGDQICGWEELMRTTSLLVYVADEYKLPNLQRLQLTEERSLFSSPFQKAEQLSRLRHITQSLPRTKTPYISLLTALIYAKSSRSTDPRDKVFAILPLVSPEKTHLVADYRQPHAEIYMAAVLELATSSLDFLSACQWTERATKGSPSWVPDFSQPWEYYPMLMASDPMSNLTGRLDVEAEELEDPKAIYLHEESVLKVEGYIFDTVSLICNFFVTSESSRDEVQMVKAKWEEFIEKADGDEQGLFFYIEDLRKSGLATYRSLYDPVYTGGKGDYLDLSIQALHRHLVTSTPSSVASDLDESKQIGWYRDFFTGRRVIQTKGQHCLVVPAATMAGDKVCKFRGSDLFFIVRESSPKHWIVIGDSCFLSFLSSDYLFHKYMDPPPSLQDIYLI